MVIVQTGASTDEEPSPMTYLLSRLRAHLSYANVIATLALFIALGGGAYAAATLPRNSVRASQLRANSVSAAKIRAGAVHGSDIANGTIGLTDLSSNARSALRGTQGPA